MKLSFIKLSRYPSINAYILAKKMSDVEPQQHPSNSHIDPAVERKLPKVIGFESLARCGEEVWIENNGQIYRLRRTRQGKLILTK